MNHYLSKPVKTNGHFAKTHENPWKTPGKPVENGHVLRCRLSKNGALQQFRSNSSGSDAATEPIQVAEPWIFGEGSLMVVNEWFNMMATTIAGRLNYS